MDIKEKSDQRADLNVLEQVLKTFLSIDKKILELHKCSSDDFLSLNKTLRQNHQKASYITDNVTIAFDKIGPEGNLKSLQTLKNAFIDLRQDILSFENEINSNLDVLERIQANFSLMFVPINNFRQNLTSLKLLLSNIKLTNNLYNRGLKNFSDNEAARIDAVINKVKESCPVFEENIYVIQNHLKTLYKDLGQLKILIFNDILKKLEALQSDFEIIEKHNKETLNQKNAVEKISQNCKSSVGSIITNLQYHDIIRQKMEHIQQTHKLIIDEIHENNDSDKTPSQKQSNPFFLQIPQIIEIQTAQLLHTNKDYQNAIDHISKKMIEIGQDMTAIARIYKTLSVFEYQGQSISRQRTSEIFDKLVHHKREGIEKFTLLSEDVTLIQRIVNNLFDKFRDLEMIENSIEQSIIDKISFGNLLVSEEKETASQAQQILKLYADNHFEKRKLRTLFENTITQLKDFIKTNASFVYDRKGIEKINQNLNIADHNFKEIMNNIIFLENMQDEVLEKSNEVDNASKEVVSDVQYYDFFEKTIDQLISKFESINNLIKNQGQVYFDKVDRKKGLEQIEKYYTMKSERMIHNKSILNMGTSENIHDLYAEITDPSENREGNDVEFF
jgi:hypothetical protein